MFNQTLSQNRLLLLLISMLFLAACGQTDPLAAPATQIKQISSDPITTPRAVSTSEAAQTQPSPIPISEPTTVPSPDGDIGMNPMASIMTTVVRVEQLEGGRATVFVEEQEEITALDISPETSFIYENGTPASLTALQIGSPIRATGGASGGGGGALYAHEVVILTPPAGDAGVEPVASIMTTVVRVEQLEDGRATVFVEEQEEITALDISPETSFIYEDGTPAGLTALQIGSPIRATGGTSGGGGVQTTHEVVILTPPAGDAGMNPMASIMPTGGRAV